MMEKKCKIKRQDKLNLSLIYKIALLIILGLVYIPLANASDVKIFSNSNKNKVYNLNFQITTFKLTQPMLITRIDTYHWNDQKGAFPGEIGIKGVGVWQATGWPGMHNTPNANWTVHPNIRLESGTYSITDSDPATWSQNSGSGGFGFVEVFGKPIEGASSTAAQPPRIPQRLQKTDKLGSEWHETEGRYQGIWKRRGNSNVFDGTWNNGVKGVLVIELNDNKVTINRNDSDGLKITYEGIISADGKTINGNEWFTGKPGTLIGKWFATIVK
ncbi:hypothetical protein [Psychromonas antarctica]|uniref:hypothetical protein n=1 Tax=Psychromonas antarctica TaxID=67573 RepID=UPI001EE8CD00|nr:hypothetical protein [Psychromonas antarctica]MCG6202295.1 hypothetical protein [Psychromonas antarctica]